MPSGSERMSGLQSDEPPWWHAELARTANRIPPPPRPPIAREAPAKASLLSDAQLDFLWLTLHGFSGTAIAFARGKSASAINDKIRRAIKQVRGSGKVQAAKRIFGYTRDWTRRDGSWTEVDAANQAIT